MSIKEYPKALYLNGDQAQDCRVVDNADEQSAAEDDGYEFLTEAKPAPKKSKKASGSTAIVDPVLTKQAAETPEKGNIYATTGSAPTPGFPDLTPANDAPETTTDPVKAK